MFNLSTSIYRHFSANMQCQAYTLAQGHSVPGAGLVFVFVELQEISVSSLLWPVLILMSGSSALKSIDCSPYFGVNCLECLLLSSRLFVNTVSSMGSRTQHWGMPIVTSHWSWSLSVQRVCIHFITHPSSPYPAQPGYKDVIVDQFKRLTRIKTNNTLSPSWHSQSL